MNERSPVVLSIEGNLEDGKMLVTCGQDICTKDVPNLTQQVIEQPYPVYKTLPVVERPDHFGVAASLVAMAIAIFALARTFKQDPNRRGR